MPDKEQIDVEKLRNYWINSSEEDFETMLSLYDTGHYHWAFFVGHLSLEKQLKRMYVDKFGKLAPFIHDLLRLAELNDLNLSFEQTEWLDEITLFNLKARYDDYKKRFYMRCSRDFTTKWIEKIKQLRSWIETML